MHPGHQPDEESPGKKRLCPQDSLRWSMSSLQAAWVVHQQDPEHNIEHLLPYFSQLHGVPDTELHRAPCLLWGFGCVRNIDPSAGLVDTQDMASCPAEDLVYVIPGFAGKAPESRLCTLERQEGSASLRFSVSTIAVGTSSVLYLAPVSLHWTANDVGLMTSGWP